MTQSRTPRVARLRLGTGEYSAATIRLQLHWWLSPLAGLLLVAGLTALVSISLPSSTYTTWLTPKYLGASESALLMFAIAACAAGIVLGSLGRPESATREVRLERHEVAWLVRTYKVTLGLALFGYVMWMLLAVSQGVGIADLAAVVSREGSAIGQLKSNSRPVGGLTTWTQLGPIAVATGFLLRRAGFQARGIWVVIALSAFRTLFYAERLALLETTIPAVLILALTTNPGERGYKLARIAPFIAPPAVWSLFAISEYTRSWVYYSTFTDQPFTQWVSVRMLGYYTTSYNNSAMLHRYLPEDSTPYFSVDAFWNAPGIGGMFDPGTIGTVPASNWWSSTLQAGANFDFTNTGSFLVMMGEFGVVGGAILIIAMGFVYGRAFRGVKQGSIPALLTYSVLLVGLLELPRFNYLSLGRATPLLLGLVIVAMTYPRGRTTRASSSSAPAPTSTPTPA